MAGLQKPWCEAAPGNSANTAATKPGHWCILPWLVCKSKTEGEVEITETKTRVTFTK